jgi:hypothetical protein
VNRKRSALPLLPLTLDAVQVLSMTPIPFESALTYTGE